MAILNQEEDFLKDLEKEIMTIKHQMSSETYRIKGWVINLHDWYLILILYFPVDGEVDH